MQWIKYLQKLNGKRSAITTAPFMLYNMEIGADLRKIICCVFLASICPPCQDVPNVKLSGVNSVISRCPASIKDVV